jgi:hypothetical protein
MTTDRIMQYLCLIGVAILAYIISGHEAWGAEPEQITLIESQAESAARLFKSYGYPIMAFIGAPYLSWRVTQWLKLAYKRQYHRKPHWLALDFISWIMVFGLSFRSWIAHNGDIEAALFIALAVSFTHTAIVKALFNFSPKPIAEVLQYGVSSEKTLIATIIAGRDLRNKSRENPQEIEDNA